jgi:hypothetical protein
MNREQIEKAIEGGGPFTIRMADGREYEVPHRDFISLPPKGAYAIVYEVDSESGVFDVLPMLTMTGIRRNDSSVMREEPE